MSTSRSQAMSMSSGKQSTAKAVSVQNVNTMPSASNLRFFDPCAATASMFVYAQGSSVVCCHHDTLTIESRFSRHTDEVQLLAVDNQSAAGAGRLVVSYDSGQTAIVWDLMTGDEVARFASYEHLTAAAWVRNGSVAFGNTQGSIILFEPSTSEYISSRTLDQIEVTALAPSCDCRTFAIGYQNGSLLIATLQPRFTILHNLTTARGPSPIVTLSWHGSSSKQKSDMLASQTHEGDLRVWSVAKSYTAEDPVKVVRILKKSEHAATSPHAGPNWMAWPKNGRIIQFSDSETLSWDVRTRHVTSDPIPTFEQVKGIAVYGPGATLFTVGPNNTIQQFDLNSPSIMVANVQHPANLLPPSPPNSIEETGEKSTYSSTTIHTSESESSSVPVDMVGVSESDEDHLSPLARLAKRQGNDLSDTDRSLESASPNSNLSGVSSLSKSSAGSRTPGRHARSLQSRGPSENTYISAGSPFKSSTIPRGDTDNYSMGYTLPTTTTSSFASSRSKQRPSRLRNEVSRSPQDDNKVHDIFKYTRARLSDIPYKHPARSENTRLTNEDMRRQMLSTIFGWHKGVEELIRDEMSRHVAGSSSRILLAKWLGDIDTDVLAAGSENMTSSDWMLLALSGIGGQASQHKLGRAYVQRLLEGGEVHPAVTIMLGLGDENDAIEIYISHKRYMEALILTSLKFPDVWERQAAIIRKWGEWAVQHGQQQLAIRCFACTDQEPSEPWTSPSATQLNFQSVTPSIPEVLSPPLSPPGLQRGPQRSVAKTSALKLITSFGAHGQNSKFYSQADGGQTPIAAGITPIAESAVSPWRGMDAATAFIRPSNNSRFNTPVSTRNGGLPSIGETPADTGHSQTKAKDTADRQESQRRQRRMSSVEQDNMAVGIALERAVTASPMMMRGRHHRSVKSSPQAEIPPPPSHGVTQKMQDAGQNGRNGSRDRIPEGVRMQLEFERTEQPEVISPEQSVTSSSRYHWPSRRRGPSSTASSTKTSSSFGRSVRSNTRNKDDIINSLEAAQHYSNRERSRHRSREPARESSRGRQNSDERTAGSREASEKRGRTSARPWQKPKRSPTSPIPMSPEDLANLSTPKFSEFNEPVTVRKPEGVERKSASRTSSRASRRKSLDNKSRSAAVDLVGRHQKHDGSSHRSPTSPVPLSSSGQYYQGSEDEEDYQLARQHQELFRAKHCRSGGLGSSSPSAETKNELPESGRKPSVGAASAAPVPRATGRATSAEHAGDLRHMKEERQRKREEAARELEERRKSLARRDETARIPHPNESRDLSTLRIGLETAPARDGPEDSTCRNATEPEKSMYARNGPHIGLPATPKAMRLVLEGEKSRGGSGSGDGAQDTPEVPTIPSAFCQVGSAKTESRGSPDTPAPAESQVRGEAAGLLTMLPSTVYQPSRPTIPRSLSAPIPHDTRADSLGRKENAARMQGIDQVLDNEKRRSQEAEQQTHQMPPPPLLKELQHLALPPPPPPAPLPHMQRPNDAGVGHGVEVVTEEDNGSAPVVAPNDGMVPVLSPPAPPAAKGHSRGRGSGEGGSIFSKATGRFRSASRGRREAARTPKSQTAESPYESVPHPLHQLRAQAGSVPPPVLPPVMYGRDASPGHRRQSSKGLHKNEMI